MAKKVLLLLIALLLIFTVASCDGGDKTDEPCDVCVDGNGDGKCDSCKKDIPTQTAEDILLFDEDGIPTFKIVLSAELPSSMRQTVNTNIKMMLQREYDIEIDIVVEGKENDEVTETEILIGNVKNRGDKYSFDGHSLGKAGYSIRPVGTKLLIAGGSDETLTDAVMLFADDFLGVNEPYDLTFTANDIMEYIQNDYYVTSLKVNGSDMRGYTLAADLTRDYYLDAAELFRDKVYTRTGYWFEIVDSENATDRSIVLTHNKELSDTESFKASVSGTRLMLECAYDNKLSESVEEFMAIEIFMKEGDVDFNSTSFSKNISTVRYEDFGTVGDGKINDFDAIYNAHEFANISGQTVLGKKGAKYYIFDTASANAPTVARTVTIKTNVNWQGAEFIIDDTNIGLTENDDYKYLNKNIFSVQPDSDLAPITLYASNKEHAGYISTILGDGITRKSTHIEIPPEAIGGWTGAVMIAPQNSSHKVYRRKGYGAASGATMQEVMFDFQSLSNVTVYRLDESTAIRIENGTFRTLACRSNIVYTNSKGELEARGSSISRGISIQRSYTTLYNIKHYVENEIKLTEQIDADGKIIAGGPAYSGFFSPSNANHITVENCVLSGRRAYVRPQGGTTGTYDLSGNMVNFLIYKDCIQHNFWVTVDPETYEISPAKEGDEGALTSMSAFTLTTENGKKRSLTMHWGIGGTNWCKNMIYDGSTLSRFDAHQGLYNGAIIDSTINYIELTGNGLFEMAGTRWFSSSPGSNALLPLRADYGWTWEGEMKVKDTEAFVYTTDVVAVCYFGYTNWYFGYTCAFPSIELDNVDFYDIEKYYFDYTLQPLDAGYEVWLTKSKIKFDSCMHLNTSHTNPIYSIEDNDKDGFIDEPCFDRDGDGIVDGPIDLDGNGKVGNTSFVFSNFYNGGEYDGDGKNSGVADTNSKINLCRVIPPKYIKIINNDGVGGSGGYTYLMWDTSGYNVSNGEYYTEENYGGFFGGTKFIYGEGDNDFFLGTNHSKQTVTQTFKFVK